MTLPAHVTHPTGHPWRPSRRRPVPAAVAAAVASLLLVTSCSVGGQDEADRIDPQDVPFGLLEASPSTAPPTEAGASTPVYLVADEQLVAVDRPAGEVDGPDGVVGVLEAGPTEDEAALGISSPLGSGLVGEVALVRGVVGVDLLATFAELPSADQSLAVAQLVYTLTGQPGVGGVSFTLDGEPVEIPRGDGSLSTDALTREDFVAVAPTR